MTKSRIAKYVANTALLAVLAAAGIGVYQLGTSGTEEKISEKVPSYYDEGVSTEITQDNAVDAGTDLVEAELEESDAGDAALAENTIENSQTGAHSGSEIASEESTSSAAAPTDSSTLTAEQTTDQIENAAVNTSAGAQNAPQLSFSEDTLMEWPVNGTILLDYNMDQTVYYPTLDQYKLSPAIAVQAVEGAPVLASVPGTVYSIENSAQTGTTVTMEIGSGYQAVYGQLKDLTVQEGDTVKKGDIIGYVSAPTKYYSKEGSNLYFEMKKNGEPVDPIAYLP